MFDELLARGASAGTAGATVAGSRIDGVLQVDLFGDFRARLGIGDDENFRLVHMPHLLLIVKMLDFEKPTMSFLWQ
ncbi:MAG: hypothetical protein Q8R26_03335 [bacterium]|nr:hypothetical protein [bacterium]